MDDAVDTLHDLLIARCTSKLAYRVHMLCGHAHEPSAVPASGPATAAAPSAFNEPFRALSLVFTGIDPAIYYDGRTNTIELTVSETCGNGDPHGQNLAFVNDKIQWPSRAFRAAGAAVRCYRAAEETAWYNCLQATSTEAGLEERNSPPTFLENGRCRPRVAVEAWEYANGRDAIVRVSRARHVLHHASRRAGCPGSAP
eukprot:354546-Chlamydomonas_euryale.AAC.1